MRDLQTTQIEMASDYRYQIWFSLNENQIVFSNIKTAWDLCFDASAKGSKIILNGSKAMKVFRTEHQNLADVTDTTGFGRGNLADMPSGNLDSTAIGDWQAQNRVYIINRGYDENGQIIGYIKLKVISVSSSQYTFEYGEVYGTQIFKATVSKNSDYNFVGFSFSTHKEVFNIEPKKTDFDLCFTIYTHLFTDPVQFYQVTGVFTNCYKTRVAKITDLPFGSVAITDTVRTFSAKRNVIGYDWKSFDLTTNIFNVDPTITYIIHDNKGFYYKLHFIDFYNNAGLKGAPKFEFKKL